MELCVCVCVCVCVRVWVRRVCVCVCVCVCLCVHVWVHVWVQCVGSPSVSVCTLWVYVHGCVDVCAKVCVSSTHLRMCLTISQP